MRQILVNTLCGAVLGGVLGSSGLSLAFWVGMACLWVAIVNSMIRDYED